MVRKCCVPGCQTAASLPSHAFPKDPQRIKQWIEAIRHPDLFNLSLQEVMKYRVCFEHFPAKMVKGTGKIRNLCEDAVPIFNLPQNKIINMSNIITLDNIEETALLDTSMNYAPLVLDGTTLRSDEGTCSLYDQNLIADYVVASTSTNTTTAINNAKEAVTKEFMTTNLSTRKQTVHKHFSNRKKTPYDKEDVINTLKQHREKTKESCQNHFQKMAQRFTIAEKEFFQMVKNKFQQDQQGSYTVDQKILALSLYKTMGERAYKFIKNLLPLPPMKMLTAILDQIPLEAGLMQFMLQKLKEAASTMSNEDKVCVLIWNEMSLQPHVEYITRTGRIHGLENWGFNRLNVVADHVLVFMLRGLHSGWKMPVSYSFCSGKTSAPQLVWSIKEIIRTISEVGFCIVGTVCDQSTSNAHTIQTLLEDTRKKRTQQNIKERQTFQVGNIEVVPLFDPLQLIIGIRNNLITKHLEIDFDQVESDRKFAVWDVITAAYMIDKHSNKKKKQLSKLTDEHVMLNKMKEINAEHAVQIVSSTVSGYIKMLCHFVGPVKTKIGSMSIDKKSGLQTSRALYFFNNLFDSVNANEFEENNELRSPVTVDSVHHLFWPEAKRVLNGMRYVDPITLKPVTTVSTLNNWVFTLDGFQLLWQRVKELGYKSLKTRYLSQDSFENVFKCVKSYTIRDTNPTAFQFEESFKILLINNLLSPISVSTNSEVNDVNGKLLFTLKQCVENECSTQGFDEMDDLYDDVVVEETPASNNDKDLISKMMNDLDFCEHCAENFKEDRFPICVRIASVAAIKYINKVSHLHNIEELLLQHIRSHLILSFHNCDEHKHVLFEILGRHIVGNALNLWCQKKNINYR